MTPEEIARIRRRLLAWYDRRRRHLPWRRTGDPYRIWVSEVMLQQTRVETVIAYYARFLRRYPTIARLAEAAPEEVLKAWEGLGYYARARNLHRAARILRERHGGSFPADPESFRALPGVGDYTAAAVYSIAFGRPLAVVDGNVRRVLARVLALPLPVDSAPGARRLRETADRLLSPRRPGDFNQAVMELGALVCTPRRPGCPGCPILDHCRAGRRGEASVYPRKRPSHPLPTVPVAVGVVFKNGRVLVTRRPEEGLLGGLWEFPGGKIEPGEDPREACRREIAEETGLAVEVGEPLALIRHAYSHFRVELHAFRCRYLGGRVRRKRALAHRWLPPARLGELAFPRANQRLLPLLRRRANPTEPG
ncbi:MAG: A/G-specific adenine glycosylase [Desulfobacterales bacterium]